MITSRRRFLSAAALGGLGTALSIVARGARAQSSPTTSPASTASATTTSSPSRAEYTVEGPFANGQLRKIGDAASFVVPRFASVIEMGTMAFVSLYFTFAGAEDPHRLIRITVIGEDQAGKVLFQRTSVASDMRIEARKTKGKYFADLHPDNTPKIAIPPEAVAKLHRIRIRFREL